MKKALIYNLKRNYSKNWKPNVPVHQMSISLDSHKFPHPIWNLESAENVEVTHFKPTTVRDRIAYYMMKILRLSFDKLSYCYLPLLSSVKQRLG